MDMDLSAIKTAAFSPTTLWVVWSLMLIVWITMTAILMYHWNSYSTADPKVRRMKVIYFIGALLLFGSATTFIFSL